MADKNLIQPDLRMRLTDIFNTDQRVIVLTGAGVSAESGIPTFRGPEGYWTVGSKVYQPQEIATNTMLMSKPEDVWMWFLYRRGVCRKSQPNPGHLAIVEMEQLLGDRFILITQNVDGLHNRAGNSLERTYKIHGDLEFMRCMYDCTSEVFPIPEAMPAKERGSALTPEEWDLLICPNCGRATRPHVLLWDECYNEEHYRFSSSLKAADEAGVLIVVGTTGSTNLPNQVASRFIAHGGLMIDINIEPNIFGRSAEKAGGYFIQSGSAAALPQIVSVFEKA